jgi:hypothetical protein
MVTHTKKPGDNFLAPHLRRVVERSKVQIVPLVDHPVQCSGRKYKYTRIGGTYEPTILVEDIKEEKGQVVLAFKIKDGWLVFCVHR